MPPLHGFSDNPLSSRDDVVQAAKALIRPLIPYFSAGHARIRFPTATGAHFDETAAQLEGFARPLWVVAPLLAASEDLDADLELLQPWIDGLDSGTDPEHDDYWGPIRDIDQKMVECEMVSFALLSVPRERLWHRLRPEAQHNVTKWLLGMHGKEMPPANWLWFRVFANLALIKTCGEDTPAVRASLKQDLEILDTFYLTDGWSGDGLWRSPELDEEEWRTFQTTGQAHSLINGRNACYYSGSFAIQFSQLLYVRFAGDLDLKRAERYRQQARDFGASFWRYFDSDGAAIPFGRSLIYRFACGGFFAALALAGVEDMPKPLDKPGAIKGFLLRHLRWWARHSEYIFYPDGTLNLGWTFPNMYMTESYNSPQSVYWALKSLVIIGLGATEDFWTEPETAYPDMHKISATKLLQAPKQVVCNHPQGNHHFMLSFSQFLGIHFKGGQAKYCKFAYSSAFGFSVPNGPASLRQIPPDNTLAFSRDGGETWAVKYKSGQATFSKLTICDEEVPVGRVAWYPWIDRSVTVTTTIVPPTSRWPDWHIRIHKIKANRSLRNLRFVEGGFAINSRQGVNKLSLPLLSSGDFEESCTAGITEGILKNDSSVLIMSDSGASGISVDWSTNSVGVRTMTALEPEPNTNLFEQRSIIPCAELNIHGGLEEPGEITLVSKVFAISSKANGSRRLGSPSLKQRWLDEPKVGFGNTVQSDADVLQLS